MIFQTQEKGTHAKYLIRKEVYCC